jgi:hypothetical protein
MNKECKVEPELVADSPELLRYKAVKKALGITDNTAIRSLVNAGKLVRVRVGPMITQMRITKASLVQHLKDASEVKDTREFFGVTPGQWAERMRNAKREQADRAMFGPKEAAITNSGTPVTAKDKPFVIEGLGMFAGTDQDYVDPVSRRLVPAGCYIDHDESIVCGQIAPCYAERITQVRLNRRGMNLNRARYMAAQVSTKVDAYFVKQNEARLGEHNRRVRNETQNP